MSSFAWEVWSSGTRYEEPLYIASYSDKGQARARIRRLQASQRREWGWAYRYEIRRRRIPLRHLASTGGARARRAQAHWQKQQGW